MVAEKDEINITDRNHGLTLTFVISLLCFPVGRRFAHAKLVLSSAIEYD